LLYVVLQALYFEGICYLFFFLLDFETVIVMVRFWLMRNSMS
jgi:hypothetical protein